MSRMMGSFVCGCCLGPVIGAVRTGADVDAEWVLSWWMGFAVWMAGWVWMEMLMWL